MAYASLDIWAVAEPRWRAAGPLLDREIRRVGTAAVRGGMVALSAQDLEAQIGDLS